MYRATAGPTSRIVRFLGVVVTFACLAATGCSTVQSIDFPWENEPTAGSNTEQSDQKAKKADGAEEDADSKRSASTSDPKPAVYWARRGVTASRRVAYGAGVEAAARNNPKAVASADTEVTAPHGRWNAASDTPTEEKPRPDASSNEGPARAEADPETRSIDRETTDSEASSEPSESPDRDADQPDSEASADQTTASTAPSRPSPDRPPERTSDAGSHGWPVGLPEEGAVGSGARSVVDPTAETEIYRLDDSEDRSKVVERWGLNPPSSEGAVAISGTFLQNIRQYDKYDDLEDEQLDNQIAVVVPGEKVAIYAGERQITTMKFPGSGELPDELATVRPVRAVDDETTQLLTFWQEESSEDEQEVGYRVGILKPIGPYVGTIFERTVATRPSPKADLRRAGYLEFLRGSEHRLIQWTPADDAGEPSVEDANVLEWNEWEGVYRVPKPPPTAPDQRS